jgi:hypothetical protein
MWDKRFNDLWLYPMPGWFIDVCNRFGGTRVLDGLFIAELIGVACLLVGWLTDLLVVTMIGWALIAPAVLLILLMIGTAQYHHWVGPQEGNDAPPDSPTSP